MTERERAKQKKEAAGIAALSGLITLQDVTDSSTADLIAKVAGQELGDKGAADSKPSPSVVQLLERFERCDKELARLQQQMDLKVERLRREVGAEEGAYRGQAAGLEGQWVAARGAFTDLEGRMNRVTQAATKIGNRLQNADLYRRRALEAIEAIDRLQEFARARDPSDLSPLFHDDVRLAEAAAMTGKLLVVSQELISSRERVGLAGPRPRPNVAPEVGTIENAVEQLELYRNLLDNRVVSRFDAALTRQDLPTMADCARIMAQFSRGEAILVQRYISNRPMFTNLREVQFVQQQQQLHAATASAVTAGGASGGGGVGEAAEEGAEAADLSSLRALSSFYKSILSAMRDEAIVIEQVFPSPYRALFQYVQRVFEQKVQTAVDAVLVPPPPSAGAGVLRARLRLMAEVYRKTRGLADDLQELCGGGEGGSGSGGSRLRQLADGVCGDALGAYLPMELRWLAALYKSRLAAHRSSGRGLCMEELLGMLAMNEEAVSRCALLSPPAQLASAVRCLFHSSTRKQANTGCLLEQVAAHLLLGLGLALDACTKALLGPFRPHQLLQQDKQAKAAAAAAAAAAGGSGGASALPPSQQQQQQQAQAPAAGPVSCQDLQRAAALGVAGSLSIVLQAVSTVGAMVSLLQQHYQRVVAPHLADSNAEGRACMAGLGALVHAVEERVLGALQRSLALLISQADMTLVAEQQRADFCPPESGAPPLLDAPTPACVAVCALLAAVVDNAEQHLHGPNLTAFLAELGRRTCLLLEAHMQRFAFSPLGALRWKGDLAHYGATAARMRTAQARQHLEEMQAGVNMLIVSPDSLLALVDGNLRISHRAALTVIQLRQDFRTARVGEAGTSLAALFASE